MKKFISFALAASMVISMVPATAFASSDLSTSHSNIRTTTNSEFLPKSIADAKKEGYRDVPYILLEAKSNFNNDEQTFELALENAEWLEADGTWTKDHEEDEDKLYMEIKEIMENDFDGVRIEPDGYNPNTKPDDGTSTPSTPSTPSDTVESTEKAYRDAVDKMLDAKKAYDDAVEAADDDFKAAKAEYDTAVKDLKEAQDAIPDLEKEYEAAQKALQDLLDDKKAFEEGMKIIKSATYQRKLVDALRFAVYYSSVTGNENDFTAVLTSAAAPSFTAEVDGTTVTYYRYDSTASGFASAFYTSDTDIENDTAIKSVLDDEKLYLADSSADDLTSAPVAATSGELYYIELSDAGVKYLQNTGSTGWVTVSTPMGDSVIKTITLDTEDNDFSSTVKLGETAIEEGIGKYITLSTAGKVRDKLNGDYKNQAKVALKYLQTVEENMPSSVPTEEQLKAAQDRADKAEKDLNDAKSALTSAQKALEDAEAKMAGYTDMNAKLKEYQDLQKAREDAAIKYMGAVKNASGTTEDDSLGSKVVAIDDEKKVPAELQNTNKEWGTIYRESLRSGKSAVAEEFKADILGTNNQVDIDIQRKSDTRIVVTTSGYQFRNGDVLKIPMFVKTTGGIAKVSIDSLDSEFTSEGKTFARTSDGDTKLSIEKVQNFYDSDEIKNLYIEELVPGTLEPGKYISLRVNGDFQLRKGANFKITQITGDGFAGTGGEWTDVYTSTKDGGKRFETGQKADEIYILAPGALGSKGSTTKAVQLRIEGLQIAEDGADFGDEATLTISGAGTSKETITIGTYEDYGVKLTAEDKDLPVIYAGTRASSKYDNQTLKVTIEETVANSFINNRKMELTLPEGVEFVDDNNEKAKLSGDIDQITEDFKLYNFAGSDKSVKQAFTVEDDGSKITINSRDLGNASADFDSSGKNKDKRRKIEFSVHVSAAADFTGDVVMTLSGAAVADREMSATIATVKAPIEVKTDVNELKIDYRNTEIADITLIEPEAGLWAKDDKIYIQGERMSFEDGAKAEVVSGDMKLDKLDGDYVDTDDDGDDDVLYIKVDSRSNKTPAEIKISNLSLYMNRALAAGDYKLKVFGNNKNEFFMNNYDRDGDDYANAFETQKVTVMSDFVKVVTAGREQDDSTFTTQVVVPIGSDVIQAGTREIKLSEMAGGACPSAYINNDGYTMLPVRAVTEALNGIAIVRWDDATKTCTVSFGQRVFSMTVGSKVLNMNGVSTALNAAPEIKDSRVFLPLRDLGYALGLSESQISWDATTQTARLN